MSTPPQIFDRNLLSRRLGRAAKGFAQVPFSQARFLKDRMVADQLETLSAVNRRFDNVLDIGARDGAFAAEAMQTGQFGSIVSADPSAQMLSAAPEPKVQLDDEVLPFDEDHFDLIVSSQSFHAVNDLPGVLVQVCRALKPDGLFIGAMFGGETLIELRQCLMEAELEVRGGYGPRISPFAEGADLIDLLKRTGFAMPVVDSDRVSVSYDNPLRLMADLRAMGETNILYDRPRKGLNKAIVARLCELYAQRFSDDEGRITATFEIITLSGWKPHESQQKPLKPGSAKMRLADAVGGKEVKL